MKIKKTRDGYYTFEKRKYKSTEAIRKLYKRKLDIPIKDQSKNLTEKDVKSYIENGDEFGMFLQLERMAKCDPRYPTTFFKSKKGAEAGLNLAEKLHKMNDKQFLRTGILFTYLAGQTVIKGDIDFDLHNNKHAGFKSVLKKAVVLGMLMVIATILGFTYLKSYRIKYCQIKYGIDDKKSRYSKSTYRQECLEEPLSNFIFSR